MFSISSYPQQDSLVSDLKKIEVSNIEGNDIAEIYKLLYENTKEANVRILSTIYWALGGIITVILAIIGSSVFFNFRFNKVEVENISNRALTKIEEAKNRYANEIEEKLNEFILSTKNSIKNNENELATTYKELLKSYSENFNSQIKTNKESTEEKLKNIEKSISTNDQLNDERIKVLKSDFDYTIKTQEIRIFHNEAELWNVREVYANALRYYIKECSVGLEIDYDWLIELRSKKICETIESMDSLDDGLRKELNEFLDKIPEEYDEEKSAIIKKLDKFKTVTNIA